MAETLASRSNVSQASYLEFLGRHNEVEEELTEAQETVRSVRRRRKDLRKTIKANGINMDAFDRAIVDAKRSGEEREADDKAYRQYMMWQAKPVGFQPSLDVVRDPNADPALRLLNANELEAIDREGFDAGKTGRNRDTNPWSPGTEAYQRFDTAWIKGQMAIAETMGPGGDGNGAIKRPRNMTAEQLATPRTLAAVETSGSEEAGDDAPRRGRGRPRKSPPVTTEPGHGDLTPAA